MSAVAKTRLTNIVIGESHPRVFQVPSDKARSMLVLLSEYEVHDNEQTLSPDEVFGTLYKESSKAATLLRGFRSRDDLTQVQLADSLGTSQSAVAAMESGKRPISKLMAQKLARIFDTDYRAFL